jgi:UDP-perosamine 4-acetyltransferase
MSTRVVGIGAGGHAKSVIDVLRAAGGFEIVGLLDIDTSRHGGEVMGVPIRGGDELLSRLCSEGVDHAFIGIGSVGDPGVRRRAYERCRDAGFEVVRAIHPRATVSPAAVVGDGITVMAAAVVNAGAVIGRNVIVNTGAIVEHDCRIADHVHVATGSRLSGGVVVGEGAHVGAGAVIREGIHIGAGAIVGAGAVVVADVPERVVVVGIPARVMRPAP